MISGYFFTVAKHNTSLQKIQKKKIQSYIKLQIPAGGANPSPPVGPAADCCSGVAAGPNRPPCPGGCSPGPPSTATVTARSQPLRHPLTRHSRRDRRLREA